jgi:predicted metal-dependent phosphoesterase TrpH
VSEMPVACVDLHAHSTASDGAASPEEFVATAQRAGLTAIALTDHDTLAGVRAAQRAAEPLGIRVIAGVELSTVDQGHEVHLLGLHIRDVEAMEDELADFRGSRRTRAIAIVAKLNELGVPVTVDAVLEAAGDGAIGRPHIARALIAGGFVKDNREAFDRWLGNGRPANIEKEKLAIADAIAMIHRYGGLAVWAHPGPDGRRDRVEPLVAMGIDGLEVRHPGHQNDDTQRLGALVAHFKLVPSGGSDWHGAAAGSRALGAMQVSADWLAIQDARLAARSAESLPA